MIQEIETHFTETCRFCTIEFQVPIGKFWAHCDECRPRNLAMYGQFEALMNDISELAARRLVQMFTAAENEHGIVGEEVVSCVESSFKYMGDSLLGIKLGPLMEQLKRRDEKRRKQRPLTPITSMMPKAYPPIVTDHAA